MKQTKKILALALAIMLTLALVPMTALAATPDEMYQSAQIMSSANGDGRTPYNLKWVDGAKGQISFDVQTPNLAEASGMVDYSYRVYVFRNGAFVGEDLVSTKNVGATASMDISRFMKTNGSYEFLACFYDIEASKTIAKSPAYQFTVASQTPPTTPNPQYPPTVLDYDANPNLGSRGIVSPNPGGYVLKGTVTGESNISVGVSTTITLDNINFTTTGISAPLKINYAGTIAVPTPIEVTIVLVGDNYLTAESTFAYTQSEYATVRFTGDGTLTLKSNAGGNYASIAGPTSVDPGATINDASGSFPGAGTDSASTTPTTPTQPTTPPAPDTPSSWAVAQVNAAIAENLVPANLQSKYTQAATRAEFAALAVALYENQKGEITGRSKFNDTTDINVEKAAFIGVVAGVGDNNYAPDTQLTREQAAVMLSRLAEAVGKPIPASAPTFADNSSIASWAYAQVGQIQAAGIMSGVGDNTFAPQSPYTREQSIITIMRLFDYLKTAPTAPVTPPSDQTPPITPTTPVVGGVIESYTYTLDDENIYFNLTISDAMSEHATLLAARSTGERADTFVNGKEYADEFLPTWKAGNEGSFGVKQSVSSAFDRTGFYGKKFNFLFVTFNKNYEYVAHTVITIDIPAK